MLPLVGEALEIVRQLASRSTDGYLFPRGKGNPWGHYRAAFEHAVKRAQLANFSFHGLRHSAASYLVQMGVPLIVVSEILAHSSVTMTQRYAHLDGGNVKAALELLAQRLVM